MAAWLVAVGLPFSTDAPSVVQKGRAGKEMFEKKSIPGEGGATSAKRRS
jgi:hypothetical protein